MIHRRHEADEKGWHLVDVANHVITDALPVEEFAVHAIFRLAGRKRLPKSWHRYNLPIDANDRRVGLLDFY